MWRSLRWRMGSAAQVQSFREDCVRRTTGAAFRTSAQNQARRVCSWAASVPAVGRLGPRRNPAAFRDFCRRRKYHVRDMPLLLESRTSWVIMVCAWVPGAVADGRDSDHGLWCRLHDRWLLNDGGYGSSLAVRSSWNRDGVVGACAPPMTPDGYQKVPVGVLLVQHGRTIERQTVTGTHAFVFHVPPGDYVVQSAGTPTLHIPATVRSGGSTIVDLPSLCS